MNVHWLNLGAEDGQFRFRVEGRKFNPSACTLAQRRDSSEKMLLSRVVVPEVVTERRSPTWKAICMPGAGEGEPGMLWDGFSVLDML